jgi:hypothetical protein
MHRKRMISASEPAGGYRPSRAKLASRARPCTVAKLLERDRELARRVLPVLPATSAEVAARLGIAKGTAQQWLLVLRQIGVVRCSFSRPGLCSVRTYRQADDALALLEVMR